MPFHPKDNTGRMYDNKTSRTNKKAPDYSGTATVNGVLMRVVGWHNPPNERQPKATINLRFQDYEDAQREAAEKQHKKHPKTPGSAPVPTEDWDDAIPF